MSQPQTLSLPVNQSEINVTLWRACDTFRGTVDASEYKNYLLVMLFVKYISDVWAEHYSDLKEQYGDDDERIRRHRTRDSSDPTRRPTYPKARLNAATLDE